jgi:uncharacterized RDD family membrane protein YckC
MLRMAAEPKQLDDTIEIVTPENIAFEYRVAGPFRRVLAYAIDMVLRLGLAILMSILLCMGFAWIVGEAVFGLIFIIYFFITWLYGGLFETFMNGQTPGKRMIGIRVLTAEGQPINGMQAMIRNILRTADELPPLPLQAFPWIERAIEDATGEEMMVFYFIPTFVLGLVVMASNRRFQRLGDLVCGTVVIIEERQWLTGVAKLEDPRAAQLAEYIPAGFVVNRSMAKAISAYVDRRRFFSPARRREVARHLADPLLRLFQLPADTSHDLLLCALYHRTFVAQRPDEQNFQPFAMQVAPPATAARPVTVN